MVSFRISDADFQAIHKKSKRAKSTLTAYLINCALNKEIVIIDGLDEAIKELKYIGNNLNQLTRLSNTGNIKSLDLGEIKSHYKNVYELLLNILESR